MGGPHALYWLSAVSACLGLSRSAIRIFALLTGLRWTLRGSLNATGRTSSSNSLEQYLDDHGDSTAASVDVVATIVVHLLASGHRSWQCRPPWKVQTIVAPIEIFGRRRTEALDARHEKPRLLGDRYELDGVVGHGGMAEVYRVGTSAGTGWSPSRPCAPTWPRDQTFQARFRREARSSASLNNPSIVEVYDTGEDVSTGVPVPYIVMEYVDGRTVRDLLIKGHRLLPQRVLEIISGVLRALEYSHQAGIVHRNIKPGNVMVTRNGDIKVMDFGIARAMSDAQATMTQTGGVMGTVQYLSPEQAMGRAGRRPQ